MIESTPDRVSLELLDSLDGLSVRFGSLAGLARAADMGSATLYKLEVGLINAEIDVMISTIADLAIPFGHIPFLLRKKGRITRLRQRNIIQPKNYREYFQGFFQHYAKDFSKHGLARELTAYSGINFSQPSVHNYLHGYSIPTVLRLEAIARFFGHVPEYLVDAATIHI